MSSIWLETTSMPEFPSLKGDNSTEVLIIGGGMAGILTAFHLDKMNVPYILVEKDRICQKTTGNTTAKITAEHGLIFKDILKKYGAATAKAYYNSNLDALLKYQKLCRNIDCDFELKDNFVYSGDLRLIEDEMKALDNLGIISRFYENTPLPFRISGAVCFPNQAQFHPIKFIKEISKGLNIYENTFVEEMIGNKAVFKGGTIKANKVIITTHFPFINKHGSYFLKLYQHRSYCLALRGAANVNGMFVSENEKGYSFRNYKDYLIVGGGGHRTGKNGGSYNDLREFKKRYYPNAEECFHWAAQDCMSLDAMPYIGNYSKRTHNLYVATGFNKWGMTGSMVAATVLSDLIRGEKKGYHEIFSPSRNIIKPQLFVNGAESVFNLLNPLGKRCPHLGCSLKWNKYEHSYDCPCHGSRFDKKGKVLDGPANGNLKIKGENNGK